MKPESASLVGVLRPIDLYVCLFLVSDPAYIGYEALASRLEISVGSAHNSLKRLKQSGIVGQDWDVNTSALFELVVHGSRYVYYVKPGATTRGVPTADSAPPLMSKISAGDSPHVWPDAEGTIRGAAIEPLHASAPRVALRHNRFYQLLALTDAIRIGGARVRGLAEVEIRRMLD